MRLIALPILFGALFLLGAPIAVAQQPPAAAAEGGENSPRAAVQKKRADCRQAGMGQGLRGPDLADHVAVCVLEGRLACLKQAIEQKVRGPQRASFISKCLGA
jgi:hypothetical protein